MANFSKQSEFILGWYNDYSEKYAKEIMLCFCIIDSVASFVWDW